MSDRPTPLTDAIRNTPLMGETVTEHKWDKMTEHARRLERERAELIEALERYGKRAHYSCDDCWYSCPLSPDGCCDDDVEEGKCNCGAAKHNSEVDALLARMKEAA